MKQEKYAEDFNIKLFWHSQAGIIIGIFKMLIISL